MALLVGEWFMFNSSWDNKHLALGNFHPPIPKINEHLPFEYDKNLVGIWMIMPYKVPYNLGQFKLIVIHFANDFRRPVTAELG